MNNKGWTIVELLGAILALVITGGLIYIGYLFIKILQRLAGV